MPQTHIALLRGINVGGKNKLPMKALKAIFERSGCSNVRTYIASGNVVFEAPASIAKLVPARVAEAVRRDHGIDPPLVTRTAREFARAVERNPFAKDDADDKALCVAFLADRPTKARVAALDPDRSPGDEFVVAGREVYLRLPNGVARTKLTNAWLDSKLGTVSTVRNWRTVRTLLEMARGPFPPP